MFFSKLSALARPSSPARSVAVLWLAVAGAVLSACGGGGGGGGSATTTPTSTAPAATQPPTTAASGCPPTAGSAGAAAASNVLPLTVDGGCDGSYVNGLFASVTLCAPGSSTNCQTIDRMLVDTGSVGLRVVASTLNGAVLGALPSQRGAITDGGVNPLAECAQFISGYTWGSIRVADARMAGERVAGLPVQLIGDTATVGAVPAACSEAGGTSLNTVAALGANGILGVGLFVNDCPSCTLSAVPAAYYSCSAAGNCAPARVPASAQVVNPVARLSVNNNGVIVTMPALPTAGQAVAVGTLTFGIGTQSNNALTTSRILRTNNDGFFQTNLNGMLYRQSFIDSGSNGLFFPSSTLPVCNSFWYCPAATTTLTATMLDTFGQSPQTVPFDVGNFQTITASGNKAVNNLAGPTSSAFDWGLPFFFGRTVYTAIQGRAAGGTPAAPITGPYFAF